MRIRAKGFREGVIAAALFALAFCAIVFPVFSRLNGNVIGDSRHPGLLGELFLQKAVFYALQNGFTAQYHVTDLVNYPFGQDLNPGIAHSLHLFFSLPLQFFFNAAASYNLLAVIIFVLNGLAMYLLARHFFASRAVSFFCGFFYMVNAYSLLKVSQGFLHKITLFWIPLYILSLFLLARENKPRYVFAAAFFLFLLYLTYAPYVYYALILTGVVVLFGMAGKRPGALPPGEALAVILGTALMVAAFEICRGYNLLAYLHPHSPAVPAVDYNGSMDVFHAFRFFPYTLPGFPGLPLGLSLTAVALAAVAALKKEGIARMLLAGAAVFTVIAMGPYVLMHGKPLLISGHPVVLPHYFLLKYLPFGQYLVMPVRSFPFLNICLALAAGFGMLSLRKIFPRLPVALTAVVFLAAYVVETARMFPELFPPRVTALELPEFYRKIKGEEFDGLLNLPVSANRKQINKYACYAALSGKKIMNPYDTDIPAVRMPGSDEESRREFIRLLSGSGIRYIVEDMDSSQGWEWLADFGPATVYEKDRLRVYELAGPAQRKGKIIRIPADARSIQEGIEKACDGDTLAVAPGRYKENINFRGKALVLKSACGPLRTVIDGGGRGSAVTFDSREGGGSVLRGFTIRNGSGTPLLSDETERRLQTNGGGIVCSGASPLILNNIIEHNDADNGGGICCVGYSSPRIENNVITGNRAVKGAGIRCSGYSSPEIIWDKITRNTASRLGGGLYWRVGSYPYIFGTLVEYNKAGERGGGIFGSSRVVAAAGGQKDVTISRCILRNNSAPEGSSIVLGPSATKVMMSNCEVERGGNELVEEVAGTLVRDEPN